MYVNTFVDTGSKVSLIGESQFNKLQGNIQVKTSKVRITSITHNVIPVLGRVSLRVFLSLNHFINHNFYIVPDIYMNVPILMGADLIGRGKFTWYSSYKHIKWCGRDYKVRMSNDEMCRSLDILLEEKGEKIILQLRQKLVLPPNSVSLCHFNKLEKNHLYLVEKFKGRATKDINIAQAGVFTTNHEGVLSIPIWTKRTREHLLRPGSAVVTVTPILEENITYCTRLGSPIGTKTQIVTRNPKMLVCEWHRDILELGNTPLIKGQCSICFPRAHLNQVKIQNDMLPHFDVAPKGDRVERLKYLINQLNLDHLDQDQREELEKVLLNFTTLFVLDDSELGCIKGMEENIPLLDEIPVRSPLYRYPEQAKETINEMIEEMLGKGVIEPSSALYLAPIVLVNKGSGKKRMCIDYRKVNEHIKQDIYPLPRLDALVEEVAGHKYYCTLDLKDAYYQIKLNESTRDITTFSDGIGLYRFTRLPFGLSVSPAIFTRAMQRVLEPLVKKGWVRNYLDDVIIYAPNYGELLIRLSEVLQRFLEMGLKLNVSKCDFAKSSIKFLGHIITSSGMKPDPGNVEKVLAMNPPKTVKQVRRFNGMVGFYRKFIPDFSKIAAPLTDLTKKDIKFIWSPEAQKAFEILKQKLVEEPILVKYDVNKNHELHTDASKYHVGAVLLQRESSGLKSVGYFSRKLNKTEQKYGTTDKEAYAIVHGCRFFHHYLWGRRFLVVTDHQPLMNIFKQKTKCQRMSRYVLEMRDYNFRIVYKPGRIHQVPDALSRPVVAAVQVNQVDENDPNNVFPMIHLGSISRETLKNEQRKDPQWRRVIEFLENGPLPRKVPGKNPITDFHIIDGILFVNKGDIDRQFYCVVVPTSLVRSACEMAHVEGHFGERKSIQRAQKLFYWPRLWMDVKNYVKSCTRCQQYASQGGLVRKWKELPVVEEKGERVSVDLIDLYNGNQGYRYCMSVMDHFSRFLRAYPLKRKTTEDVIKMLRRDFNVFGRPKLLLTDNGLEFKNVNVQKLCKELNIVQTFCMPYHPQGNSVSERVHRTLKGVMAKINDKHPNNWPEYLQDCVRIINESVHSSLGTSPFFVHFGYHPLRTVGEIVLPEGPSHCSGTEIRDIVKETLKGQTRMYLREANKKRGDDFLSVGEMVWIKNETPIPGTATKLNPHWVGPYKVIEVLGQDKGYVVENPFTGDILERGTERLKRCKVENDIVLNQEVVPDVPENVELLVNNRPRRLIRPPICYTP